MASLSPDLLLPSSSRVAAAVVHSRRLLRIRGGPQATRLLFGVGDEVTGLPWGDLDAVEHALPAGHIIDFTDVELLHRLKQWLYDFVHEEPAFANLLGRDLRYLHALAVARDTAPIQGEPRDAPPILIEGATGSGKEVLARALHQASMPTKPFVPVNCAGITPELLEDALFGHVKGGFSGASSDREGLCKRAEGGTLFIDEVGDLPMRAQVMLLRFLQDQKYRRVGCDLEREANVRIVAATWRPLDQLIQAKKFRLDLFHRLAGVRIWLPSLEDRSDEVAQLAGEIALAAGITADPALDPEATIALTSARWTGGLRELDREVRVAASRCIPGPIRLEHLSPERILALHDSGEGVRAAARITAWSASGKPPSAEQMRHRLRAIRQAKPWEQVDPTVQGPLPLVRQVRAAYPAQTSAHDLLTQLEQHEVARLALEAEEGFLDDLFDALPEESLEDDVLDLLEEVEQRQAAHQDRSSDLTHEFFAQLPGLAQVIRLAYALPGLNDHQRSQLFAAWAQTFGALMALMPRVAGHTMRAIAGHEVEALLVHQEDEPEEHPFTADRQPHQRSADDWRWLSENTDSLAEAVRISGHAKNTVRKYLELHELPLPREHVQLPSPVDPT